MKQNVKNKMLILLKVSKDIKVTMNFKVELKEMPSR